MSSKKFVYLLMTVAIVCGFIASDTAYGQSKTSNLLFKGTVRNADGTPAPGHSVAGEITGASVLPLSPVRSGPDGTYQYSFISLSNDITAGDVVQFTVTDSAQNVVRGATYTVRAEDLPAPSIVDLDITLGASIAIEANPSAIPADGTSRSTILVTLQDGGEPVTGDTVTATISPAGKGSVSAFTEVGNGVYSATYAAPSLALTASDAAQITVASTQLGKTANTTITLLIVTTNVTVTVTPSVFSADTPANGVITVTVDRAGPVADETVTLRLSSNVGMVSAVTNKGGGTYEADYTSGGTVGNVTLTATATQAGASGRATITINAGPPAAIKLSAAPPTVSSLGSATVTAMVSDSAGNGVGGLSPTGTASSGTITNFVEDTANLGMYTATYTAPLVDAEGTDTITVIVDGLSGQVSLTLTPVPPVDVSILVIEGTVFKVDGITPADGVTTTVTVGSNVQVDTTDMDGTYSVTLVSLGGVVASTGDAVSIVVTDDTGAERGREDFRLTNDQLGEGGTVTVPVPEITTDIIVPPRSVSVLVVEGVIFSDDGVNPVEDVPLTVTVTVGTSPPQTAILEEDGVYSVTAVNLTGSVASTGDMVSTVVVTDADGAVRGTAELELTNAELGEDGSGIAKLDVMTDITLPPKSVNILIVEGVAYKDDGATSVGPGLDVTITVGNTPQTTQTAADGSFATTTINLLGPAATSGDPVSIVVADSSGERGREEFTLLRGDLGDVDSATVTQNVITNIGATSGVLAVTGTVYLKNGDTMSVPAASHLREGDLTVVVTNTTRNMMESGPVDDDGGYDVTFLNLLGVVAETGDILTVDVQNEAGETMMESPVTRTLTTSQVKAANAKIDIYTTVPAEVRALNITGSVVAAGAGLEVTLSLGMNGRTMPPAQTLTDAAGGYEYTFVDLINPVAATGDILTVDVLRAADQFRGRRVVELRSYELVDGMLTVDPITLIPPKLELGGLSINPNDAVDGIINLEAIHTNPALLEMIPSGILYLDLLQGLLSSLPPGFESVDDENIQNENFGNAITPRPAWHVLAENSQPDPDRWLNGDQLNLYVLTAPTAWSVTFTLSGPQSGMVEAVSVPAGGTVPYTFQLEEERAALFLPSWPGLNADMSVFESVTLMIDGYAPMPMAQNMNGVWETEAHLNLNSKITYYYQVKLARSYQVGDETVSDWVMPDPRNLQVEDRGIVESLRESLRAPEFGPDLIAIATTMDLKLRSVFTVPEVTDLQALWVGRLDFAAGADGMYQLDTAVQYASGYMEEIAGKMFMVDRTAPTADITVAIGGSAGLYELDGSYVAAAHTNAGTLNLTTMPTAAPLESEAYLYQIIQLDDAGDPGVHVWNPVTVTGGMLPLTYMDPHQVQIPIGDVGNYGIRAVGVDSILNISSSTMPRMLKIVPPDPDIAAVTLVHADYNADGVFESVQRVYGAATIFSNASTVRLTVEMTRRTKHPLKSIAVDFLNGGRGWQPIAFLTGNDLAAAESRSPFNVNWQRAGGFTDLRQATVRVTVTNDLDVSGESRATFKFVPPVLKLGGLSINPDYAADGLISLDAIQINPDLLQLLPAGLLHADLLQGLLSELPSGFESTDENIQNENFGNAITPRPAWNVLAENSQPTPDRWLNGDQLNLYVLTAPTARSVTFTLSGPQSGMVEAVSVPAGGIFKHTFQLEEERAVLLLPSWPGLNENMPVFSGVTLMIDGHAPMPMVSKSVGDAVVWETEAPLRPGSKVAYYYQVQLAQSYELEGVTLSGWPMPDPRNLQLEDRGIVETLRAPELVPEIKAILTTMDLKLRSVFTVPVVNNVQSLWVGKFDFPAGADGAYSLDTVVQYEGGFTRSIPNQMFTLDRMPPTADIMVGIGENSGVYQRDDSSYVAAAHSEEGTLNITATPTGDPSDPGAYLYQMIQLDDAGDPGVHVWHPAMAELPLTSMPPHQIQIPVGDVGNYGIRAVGVDSILNISSNTMPRMLEIVPSAPDSAAVTLVHADYNGDGTTDGPFEMEQQVSGGVTIFSDRSNVTLTVEMMERTSHPLRSIAVDFQINGEGGWKPIAMLTGDDLADAESGLEVNWNRMDDFADLLDIRGQAAVRVTVTNALDVEDQKTVTVELVPPALQLGGLSINTGYEAGLNALQRLRESDVTALAVDLLGMDPSSLFGPSPLPLSLALLGVLNHVQNALPEGFETADEQIHRENFGNALTPKPLWYSIASADQRDAGRWINGNQLHLYTSAGPTAESLTFSITGAQTATATANKVEAGGSFMYTFQLEEELIAIFAGGMPALAAVTLMIDGHAPIDMVGNAGVWSAETALTPGSKVSYYYRVELAQPYQDMFINKPIRVFPIPDPRNLQIEIGYAALKAYVTLLNEGIDALDTLDPGMRSVFTVPAVDDDSQSLWVGKLDFPADGMYQLDVAVEYSSGSTDELTGKMFTVDRTAPTADTMVHLDTPGENIGMYLRDKDEVYVATALPNPGGASLNVSATPIDDSDLEAYLYQLARLDAAGNPGTWNPMLTVDLQAPDIMKLLSNPASAVPLTSRPPHHVQMLVRSGTGNDLDYGTYGLRVVGIDNILNADSSIGPGVVVDLVPPDPDIAMVSYVAADFDGNGAIEGLEMQSTVGDVAIFSDSIVTLTVDVERTDHPLASIVIEVEMPGVGSQPVAMFSGDQLATMGNPFTVTLPVPDIPGLPDRGSHAILRTITTNALNVVNVQEVSVAYLRRTPPEVSAIHTYVTDRHPDSGAAQGLITASAFTQAMTLPDAAAVQLEIRRSADADWMPLGIVQLADTTVTSHVQIAIIGDLVNAILSGSPTAPISPLYREWPLTVDSATLEDTIMDDSPAASDASLDDNPYVLRAIAVDTAGTGYPSADGVTDSFSLDNYSPTAITQVANEVEMVAAREDGSYYVSGLIAEGVPDPMLTLTSRTGAHPNAFTGGLKLAINDAAGEAVAIDETVFSAAGNHTYTGTLANLGSIPNGVYTFMAVGHTADGAAEERIVAMAITVEVGNFTPPDNFADPTVDILSVTNTRGEANSPSDTDAMYPIGLPAVGDEACATLIVPNVSAGDVDVLIGDDLMSAAMMGAITVMDPDANNNILVCIDTSGLDEGMYSLVGVVSKPNGSVQFGLPSIRVDRTAPVIEIVSPLEGHQVSTLPTVQVTYTDETGFDPEKTNPMPVEITLTRLASDKTVDTNPSMIRMIAAAGEVLTQTGNIVYSHDDQLAGGAYRIDATVTDALGNTATAEPVEFTSEGVAATVSIITPASGQVVDPKQPLVISAALSGSGEITVSEFSLNGSAATPTVDDNNWLTHTVQPDSAFNRGAGNTVTIKIVDGEGNTAEATSTFTLALDTTPPVVATYSPLGIIRSDRPIAAATVTDESGIDTSSLTIIIAGVPGNQGTGRRSSATSTTVTFTPSVSVTPGPYTARVTVLDVHGNRTEVEWQFTVELDVTPPAITTTSPHGVIRSDKPIISVSASDDMSGVDTIEIGVKGEGNQTVEGVTSVRSDKTSATFTPAASLTSGTYTVNVKLADMSGNKASGQWQFTVELDTIPPSITITRPMQEHTENRRPIISASYTDNLSGVDAESIKLSVDGAAIEPDAVSETQVRFTPKFDLTFGPHTVKLEVSDMAPSANTAVQEWSFFVERMGIADARNYPNPFDGDTTIALRISRQASITVRIYDFTGRLVAEPISNSVREAGPVEIKWDGQTNAGDNLARGVYFCHILMESELEPQSAILKMAIISD